jgi:hypothetical protein
MKPTPYLADQPVDDFGLEFASLKFLALLPPQLNRSLTIPGDAQRYKALIKVEAEEQIAAVFVAINGVAEMPAGNVWAPSTSEMIVGQGQKLCREVVAGDVIDFYSDNLVDVAASVSLWALETVN